MPKPTTKTRRELRSCFLNNAIPTESDFAALIAAGLNQADDGILKLPDQPLGVVRQQPTPSAPSPSTASTTSTSSPPSTASTAAAAPPPGVLNFFGGPEDDNPSWQLQLIGSSNPGFGLADRAGITRLFLDGTTGNLGVGTTTPRQKLVVEGPLSADKDEANTLRQGGQLAIKGSSAQLDFIDSDLGQTDWAINVDQGKLSFVRAPDSKDLVIDDKGNVGIGTESPTTKLHVVGAMCVEGALNLKGDLTVAGRLPLRRISFATGDTGRVHGELNSETKIPKRFLIFKKDHNHSILRIVYSDNIRVLGTEGWNSARWEIRLLGANSSTPSNAKPAEIVFDRPINVAPIYLPLSSNASTNLHSQGTILGYFSNVAKGFYEISVHVVRNPGSSNGLNNQSTGGDEKCTWSIEAEEIMQKTL
ncbi:MAG: hypothetical protein VKK97_02505 [Synechococcaceae cyanobacterium]|nr:hypothetical protein [Synechococcaceae cyanobacterium]